MYTVRHRWTGAPTPAPDVRLDASLVSEHDLIDAKALMAGNKRRLERVTRGNARGIVSEDEKERGSAGFRFFDGLDDSEKTGARGFDGDAPAEPSHSYAASTKSAENRASARAARIRETVPSFQRTRDPELSDEEWLLKTKAARANAANGRRSETFRKPSDRAVEDDAVRRMREKANFVLNPRYAASSRGTRDAFADIFVLDPPVIQFIEYEEGETYEVKLTIRNRSGLSRRLRVLPAASRYFSISECVFPSEHGLLAPGMACSTVVRFKPESLADYEDALSILGETCSGTAPIRARRHPPRLTLETELDVGAVLVGGAVEFCFPFKNVGGHGRFRLVDDLDWPERTTPFILPHENSDPDPDPDPSGDWRREDVPRLRIASGPFRVGPGVMMLAPDAV